MWRNLSSRGSPWTIQSGHSSSSSHGPLDNGRTRWVVSLSTGSILLLLLMAWQGMLVVRRPSGSSPLHKPMTLGLGLRRWLLFSCKAKGRSGRSRVRGACWDTSSMTWQYVFTSRRYCRCWGGFTCGTVPRIPLHSNAPFLASNDAAWISDGMAFSYCAAYSRWVPLSGLPFINLAVGRARHSNLGHSPVLYLTAFCEN